MPVDRNPLVPRARQLRRTMTDAEVLLWWTLRRRDFRVRFRRQAPVGRYVADFLSHEAKLIIEVDGDQHGANSYDVERDRYLAARGFKVVRFWNHEVMTSLEDVRTAIYNEVAERAPWVEDDI